MTSADFERLDLTCEACQALLPDYIRLELDNQAADAAYPVVAFHLETCPACQATYWREFDAQGMMKSLAELQQVGRQPAVSEDLPPMLNPNTTTLWAALAANLQRLTVEIPLLVKDMVTVFGQLPVRLLPQLTVTPAFRSKSTASEHSHDAIELLTLPNPAANLQIKLSTGTVTNRLSTLIVQLQTMAEQPIAQARTILRDDNGRLLEQRATDSDGLVVFSELAPAKYTIQIKQAGQTWELSVVLTASK